MYLMKIISNKSYVLAIFAFLSIALLSLQTCEGKSLEGEDSNNNGLWDDIEPYIDKHARTQRQRKALEKTFKGLQRVLVNPELGIKIKNASREERKRVDPTFGSVRCLQQTFGDERFFHGDLSENDPESAILTNSKRIEAYAKFNSNLSGGVYQVVPLPQHRENPCDF